MDGGPLDDYWMVRNELKVRHELKTRDLCQRLHKTKHGSTQQGSECVWGLSK